MRFRLSGRMAGTVLYAAAAIAILALVLLSAFTWGGSSQSRCGQITEGVADLRRCDYKDGFAIKLNGEWEFYWDELLEPEDFITHDSPATPATPGSTMSDTHDSPATPATPGSALLDTHDSPATPATPGSAMSDTHDITSPDSSNSLVSLTPPKPDYMKVPKQWMPGSSGPTEGHGWGHATYRLRLLLPASAVRYGIKVTNVRVASRLYLDGQLLGESGKPGLSATATSPRNHPYLVFFQAQGSEAELLIQASNYSYLSGGISEPIYVGDAQSVNRLSIRNKSYDLGITVCLLVLSLFFFGQCLQRNRDRASFYLAFFCACGALYMLTHSEKLLYDYAPGLSYEGFSRVQSLSAILAYWGLAGYTYHITAHVRTRWLFRWTGLAAIFLSGVVLVNDVSGYAFTAYVIAAEGLLVCSYVIYLMIRGIAARIRGSSYLLVGMLAAIHFIAMQAANLAWEHDVYAQPPLAIPLFALAQSLFLTSRYNYAYRTIRDLSDELKRKDRDKDEFLVNTSYELRKPLQAIVHISRSMTEGERISGHHRENAALIMNSAQRLSLLVNDIIDYERIMDGSIELDIREVDVSPAADMVLEIFRHLNRNGDLALLNGIGRGSCIVTADENRLTQILYSLVDTAFRHAAGGFLRIQAEREEGDEARVRIIAAFTGTTLPLERLDEALRGGNAPRQDFRMLDTDYDESVLGLRIAVRLAGLQDAVIRFSQDAAGLNRFVVILPGKLGMENGGAAPDIAVSAAVSRADVTYETAAAGGESKAVFAAAQAAASASAPGLAPGLVPGPGPGEEQPYRVLVVDNDYMNEKTITNLLLAEGYVTVSAHGGEQALRMLAGGNTFDLCVMSVKIHDMSGLSLIRTIRESYGPLDLPILLTAPRHYAGMNEAGIEAGANDIIHEPYEWGDVQARIRTLVQLKRSVSRLLDSEIAMLRAQIKPHFLYNAINTIIWMSKRDMERCRELLRDLSQFLRKSFDFGSREAMVTFASELQLVTAYLSLEQARFGDRLKVVYDLRSTDFTLPPLVVQPLVENAVRHGITQKVEGGTVYISAIEEGEFCRITIGDDGVGMDEEEVASWSGGGAGIPGRARGTGIGLGNINRRLTQQFGRPLVIRGRAGGGTEVSVHIPRT